MKENSYTIVLTHDVDHLALNNYPLLGKVTLHFIKNSLFRNFLKLIKKDLAILDYIRSLLWVIALPLVKLKLIQDPFERSLKTILKIEEEYNVRSTFFFIPFAKNPGFVKSGVSAPKNRAAVYEVEKYRELLLYLEDNGWEVGVHGINSHLYPGEAKKELEVFKKIFPGKKKWGIRIHWLYQPQYLWKNLAKSGYYYDTTFGSNEEIGFKDDKFRPFKKDGIWILPMNIQDGTLLAPWHKKLSKNHAWKEIREVLDISKEQNAVVTVLWHSASFCAPKYWGDLYCKIIEKGKKDGAKFLTALEAVEKCKRLEKDNKIVEKK